jgi:hypothetical protein
MAARSVRRTILSVEALENRWLPSGIGTPSLPPLLPQNGPPCPPQNAPPAPANHTIDVVVAWFAKGTAEYEGTDGKLDNVTEGHVHWISDGHGGWIPTGTRQAAPPASIPRDITLFAVGAGPVTIEDLKVTKVEVQYDDGHTVADYNRKGLLVKVTEGRFVWTQFHGKKQGVRWMKRVRPHGPKTVEDPPAWIDREIDANDE